MRIAPFQALLALSDCGPGGGGFTCAPAVYRGLEAWISRQPEGWDGRLRQEDHELIEVEMKIGDVLFFSPLLPHGNAANLSDRPRLAAYLGWNRAGRAPNAERIDFWQQRRRRERWPGDPQAGEPLPGQPVELTSLGRRLLGADGW